MRDFRSSSRTGRAGRQRRARGARAGACWLLLMLCFRSALFPRTHPVPAIKRSGSRPRARGAAGAAAGSGLPAAPSAVGAPPPDNDCKVKEASWISSQAWFESLRYYPTQEEAGKNDDCVKTFSGLTHGPDVPSEHLETDVRTRLGLAAPDPDWTPLQQPKVWAPDLMTSSLAMKLDRVVTKLLSPMKSRDSPSPPRPAEVQL